MRSSRRCWRPRGRRPESAAADELETEDEVGALDPHRPEEGGEASRSPERPKRLEIVLLGVVCFKAKEKVKELNLFNKQLTDVKSLEKLNQLTVLSLYKNKHAWEQSGVGTHTYCAHTPIDKMPRDN